jgi:hypothetical protein
LQAGNPARFSRTGSPASHGRLPGADLVNLSAGGIDPAAEHGERQAAPTLRANQAAGAGAPLSPAPRFASGLFGAGLNGIPSVN